MTSKRGRKRNDNLPPNRARDVQRAFRARRAAHLQALEQRVTELEEENNCLRAALNLPPAIRPPLGKGPTGKDKPPTTGKGSALYTLDSPTHDSSDAASPSSTRTGSPAPVATMDVQAPAQVGEGSSWNQSLVMREEETEHHIAAPQPYLPPLGAQIPPKPVQPYAYSNPLQPSGSRSSSSLYINNSPTDYAQRPMGTTYNAGFELRDSHNPIQQRYQYTQASYPSPHDCTVHPQLSPTVRETDNIFAHRRSLTEPQVFRPLNHYLPGSSQTIRPPSPSRHDYPNRPSPYGHPTGRLL